MADEDGQQSTEKEEAYEDRNLLALAYLKEAKDMRDVGWREAPDSSDEWVVVWIEDPFAQRSWHVPREMVEDLDWLPHEEREFDGHTREEKNQRMRKYLGLE